MADLGKSQIRQVGNLGNTPAGQTGYNSQSRGAAYYEFGSKPDAGNRTSRNVELKSPISKIGTGTDGPNYYELAAVMDPASVAVRNSKPSGGMFGGTGASSGLTQADTGPLPTPTGTSLTTYFLMRARDQDCVMQPTYVTWVVTGTPDTTGAHYGGSKCGVNPLVDIVVEMTWKQ